MVKWYDRIGNTIEMRVNNRWIKGTVINGERTGDGIVNMETANGKNYWCGVNTKGVWYRKCEDSLGDLITNADRIRSMSDEELAEFITDYVGCERCPITWCVGDESCISAILEWLKSEVKG